MTININSGVTTYVTDAAQYSNSIVYITLSGVSSIKYDVNYCGEYAAYYLGKHGGWNAFLFEGKCKRTDEVERHSINRYYNNTTIDYGEKPYVSEIVPTYELNTGWLTDSESEIFATDLLQSNSIYIHDLANDRIFPAVITDNSAPVKRYLDERKLVAYTLNVKESQTRLRR